MNTLAVYVTAQSLIGICTLAHADEIYTRTAQGIENESRNECFPVAFAMPICINVPAPHFVPITLTLTIGDHTIVTSAVQTGQPTLTETFDILLRQGMFIITLSADKQRRWVLWRKAPTEVVWIGDIYTKVQ